MTNHGRSSPASVQRLLSDLPRTRHASNLCTCADPEPIEQEISSALEHDGRLVLGEAVSEPQPWGDDSTLFATQFKVTQVLAGARLPSTVTLIHPIDSSACGIDLPLNRSVLWWIFPDAAQQESAPVFATDACAEATYSIEEYKRVLGR